MGRKLCSGRKTSIGGGERRAQRAAAGVGTLSWCGARGTPSRARYGLGVRRITSVHACFTYIAFESGLTVNGHFLHLDNSAYCCTHVFYSMKASHLNTHSWKNWIIKTFWPPCTVVSWGRWTTQARVVRAKSYINKSFLIWPNVYSVTVGHSSGSPGSTHRGL